jgi:hypothetical protein
MSSYWGTGNPLISLMDRTAGYSRDITLGTPEKGGREFYWELVADPKTNPLTRIYMPRRFGFRAVLRLSYSGAISETVEDLVEISNSKLQIKVVPYSSVPALNFLAAVTGFKTSHKDGYVNYDAAEIIFTGLELKENIPNFDIYYTVSRNKSIIATI